MELVPPLALRGQRILIVETEAPLFRELMRALENEGAETVYVTDPYSDAGAKRLKGFTVCAAVINSVHRGVARGLDHLPVLIYGPNTAVPSQVEAVVPALKKMLSERVEGGRER